MSAYAAPFAGVDYQEEEGPVLYDKDRYEDDEEEEKKMGTEAEVRRESKEVAALGEEELAGSLKKQQGPGLQLEERSPMIRVPTTLSSGSQVDLPSLLRAEQQQQHHREEKPATDSTAADAAAAAAKQTDDEDDIDKRKKTRSLRFRLVGGLFLFVFVMYGLLLLTLVISSGSFCTSTEYDYSGLGRQLQVWTSTRLVPELEDDSQPESTDSEPAFTFSWWSSLWALNSQQRQYLMAYVEQPPGGVAMAKDEQPPFLPGVICPVTAWTFNQLRAVLLPRSHTLLFLNLQDSVLGSDDDFTRQWSSHVAQVHQEERRVEILEKGRKNPVEKGRKNPVKRFFHSTFSGGSRQPPATGTPPTPTTTATRSLFVAGVGAATPRRNQRQRQHPQQRGRNKENKNEEEEEEQETTPNDNDKVAESVPTITHHDEPLLLTQDDLTETQAQLLQELYRRTMQLLQTEDLQQSMHTRTVDRPTFPRSSYPDLSTDKDTNLVAQRLSKVFWGGSPETEEKDESETKKEEEEEGGEDKEHVASTTTPWWLPASSSLFDDDTGNQPDNVLEWDGARLLHRYLKIMGWPADLKCKFPFKLCAKGCDCEVALAHTLEWRLKYQPWKMTLSAVEENQKGWMYHRGYARGPLLPSDDGSTISAGNAMIWYRPGFHQLNETEAYMRAVFYTMDAAIAETQTRSQGLNGKYHIVMDFDGFRFSKLPPLRALKRTIHIMQDHFPDRLGVLFMVNLLGAGQFLMSLVLPLLSEAVRNKIFIVPNSAPQRRAMLNRVVDDEFIPSWLGGADEYVFDPKEYYATTKMWSEEEATAYVKDMPHHG